MCSENAPPIKNRRYIFADAAAEVTKHRLWMRQ